MLKINNKKAFAIKFNIKETAQLKAKTSFFKLLKEDIIKNYPDIKIEGLTHKRRDAEVEIKKLFRIAGNIVAGIEKEILQDVILVGVSDKYDISFGYLKDLKLDSGRYAIPVISIEDANTGLPMLCEYLMDKYPVESVFSGYKAAECDCPICRAEKEEKEEPIIRYFSEYVQVGTKCFTYTEFKRTKYYKPKSDQQKAEEALIGLLASLGMIA
jgi:hypothetical protein